MCSLSTWVQFQIHLKMFLTLNAKLYYLSIAQVCETRLKKYWRNLLIKAITWAAFNLWLYRSPISVRTSQVIKLTSIISVRRYTAICTLVTSACYVGLCRIWWV